MRMRSFLEEKKNKQNRTEICMKISLKDVDLFDRIRSFIVSVCFLRL